MFRTQKKAGDEANSLLQDTLNGIRVVKAFGQEEHEVNRFIKICQKLRDITIENQQGFRKIN